MKYSNNPDIEEDSFGPGTDLVFSLVALLLIAIPVMLYVQSRTDFLNRLYIIRINKQQMNHGGTVARLRDTIRELKTENSRLSDELLDLSGQHQKSVTEIVRLTEELSKSTREKAELLSKVTQLEKLINMNVSQKEKLNLLLARLNKLDESKKNTDDKLTASQKEIEKLKQLVASLEDEKIKIKQRYRKDKPPIIPLHEASGYSFKTASAELSSGFKKKLQKVIVPQLHNIVSEFNVNTIEIVGHTDGVPVRSYERSNLDDMLTDAYLNQIPLDKLVFSSNTELGLLRALAVKRFLEESIQNDLPNVSFRIYSAAQLVPLIGEPGVDNQKKNASRRRIELRFTKLQTANSSKSREVTKTGSYKKSNFFKNNKSRSRAEKNSSSSFQISFRKYDKERLSSVFEYGISGKSQIWVNPNNGFRYSAIPRKAFKSKNDKSPCRKALVTASFNDKTAQKVITGCRKDKEIWDIK